MTANKMILDNIAYILEVCRSDGFKEKYLEGIERLKECKTRKQRCDVSKEYIEPLFTSCGNFFMIDHQCGEDYSTKTDKEFGDIRSKDFYFDIKVGYSNLAGAIPKSSVDKFRGHYFLCLNGDLDYFYLINADQLRYYLYAKNPNGSKKYDIDFNNPAYKSNEHWLGECDYGDFGHRGTGYFKAIMI